MTIPQLMPWIGGPAKFDAGLSPLVCPTDESVASHMIESDAKVVDAAVKHSHAAFLQHQDATTAKRVEWLLAAADAIDKIEGEIVRSLIRFIGKPRRAATFEAKRVGAFIRACAAQVPHLMGEVLPLDVTATGAGRFGFTTRIPYGVVAAVTPFNGPVNLLIQKVAPALAVGNAVVVKPSPPGTEVALLMAEAVKKAGVPDGLFNVVPGGRETAQAARRPSAGRRRHRHRQHRRRQRACTRRRRQEIRRRARLQRGEHRLRRRRSRRRRDAHRRRRLRGERPAMHLGAARDRRAAGLRPFPRAVRRGREEAQGRRSRGHRDRCRADGQQRGRRPRRAMVADAVAKGAKLVLKPERRGAILGPAIVARRTARGAADARGGLRAGGRGASRSPMSTPRSRSRTRPSSACRAPASPRAWRPHSRCRASCASARSGSTTPAASGSIPIRSAASARAASDAKACAMRWRSCRNGSSRACGSTRNEPPVRPPRIVVVGSLR